MVEIKRTLNATETKIVDGKPEVTIINDLEYLSCGHQNNLLLSGRVSGVCPQIGKPGETEGCK